MSNEWEGTACGGDPPTDLWRLACKDAGFGSDEVWICCLPGQHKPRGREAIHLEPGTFAVWDTEFPFSQDQIKEANSPERRNLPARIVLFREASPELILGQMRHELEHARQWINAREAYDAFSVLECSLIHTYGDKGRGAASTYNRIPLERDANAAAAGIVRAQFGEQSDEVLAGKNGNLFREVDPPGAFDSLAKRALAFASIHADSVEFVCEKRHQSSLDKFLASLHSNGSAIWPELVADPRMHALRVAVKSAVPTAAEISAAGDRPAAAWAAVLIALAEAQDRAEAIIDECDSNQA